MSEKRSGERQMTGAEINETFGDKEVLELEQYKVELMDHVDELRVQINNSWDNMDAVDEMNGQIDKIKESLGEISRKMRAKKSKFTI